MFNRFAAGYIKKTRRNYLGKGLVHYELPQRSNGRIARPWRKICLTDERHTRPKPIYLGLDGV